MVPDKKIFRAALSWAAAALLLCWGQAMAAIPIQHWTQPSGARVFLVESPTIPMVDVQIDFDAGGRRDPADKAGLAQVTAGMSSKGIHAANPASGGPYDAALDENQLSEAWADLGAGFGAGAGSDRMSFSLRSLTYPDLLPKAAQLAARQLGEPAFPEAVWQRERQRLAASIREANTRPATVAGHALCRRRCTAAHPYGYEMTEESAGAHRRAGHDADVPPDDRALPGQGEHRRRGHTGAGRCAGHHFAVAPARGRRRRCEPLPPVAEVAPLAAPVLREIPFASAQAHVLIGQPGYKRNDPDYFALMVGNYILGGGGFVSRLTDEVREKRGLSYSVYSNFSPRPARGRLHHRPADPARPDGGGGASLARRAGAVRRAKVRPKPSSRPPRTT